MAKPKQRALDLPHRPALGSEDFLVAPSNEDAVAWLDRWPVWPNGMLALYGPPGCGKSHLAMVFARRTGAPVHAASALIEGDPADLMANGEALVIEDGEGLIRAEVLFHIINAARHLGRTLLLTGRTPPSRWPVGLADLASRLASVSAVEIHKPDDSLMAAVLVKLFADRQIRLPGEALPYLLTRMERSFASARLLVAEADRLSLEGGRPVTLPLLRDVLDASGDYSRPFSDRRDEQSSEERS